MLTSVNVRMSSVNYFKSSLSYDIGLNFVCEYCIFYEPQTGLYVWNIKDGAVLKAEVNK